MYRRLLNSLTNNNKKIHLLLCIRFGQSQECRRVESRGKVFMFGVMGSPSIHFNMNDILINVVSNQTGVIGLLAPHFNMTAWHNIHVGVTSIHISKDIVCYSGIEDKGILLAAEFEVTIYVITDGEDSVQRGFLLLPMDNTKSGDVYVVSSYQPTNPFQSTYLVVAVNDYTVVSIKNSTDLIKSFQLQSFNTYQFETDDFDPSGLSITVNDSVAVFSGSECSSVFDGTRCHSMEQQLMPMASWGTRFIIPPLIHKPHNMVRLYSGGNNTKVLLQNMTQIVELHLAAFDFKEILFETGVLYIYSHSVPIQVVQYSTGYEDGDIGGSFMTIVPAIDAWMSEYTYKPLQLENNYTHYLAVTALNDDADGILINGESDLTYVSNKVVGTSDGTFVVKTMVLSEDKEYTIKHPSAKFGLLAYGYANDVAYGFILGLQPPRQECDGEPVNHITHPTIPPPSSSVTTENVDHRSDLRCFACTGLVRADSCENEVTCKSYQVCYVKRYMDVISRDLMYESGCITSSCPSSKKRFLTEGHMTVCEACCASDLCNTYCNGTGNFLQNTIGNIY